MKKIEKVIKENILYWVTDGNGFIYMSCENGDHSCRLQEVFESFGIEFWKKEMMEEFESVSSDDDESIQINVVKIKVKIESLKEGCPSLFTKLSEQDRINRQCRKYIVENNLKDFVEYQYS